MIYTRPITKYERLVMCHEMCKASVMTNLAKLSHKVPRSTNNLFSKVASFCAEANNLFNNINVSECIAHHAHCWSWPKQRVTSKLITRQVMQGNIMTWRATIMQSLG